MLLLLSAVAAHATDWYLETGDHVDRADPDAVAAAASEAGFESRVVRRFVDPAGWRWVARVEGFADARSAEVAASELAELLRQDLYVVYTDGHTVTRLTQLGPPGSDPGEGRSSPGSDPGEVDGGAGPAPEPEAVTDDVLGTVLTAHGADDPLLTKLREGPVQFAFRRTLPDGKAVDHVWAADGGDLYLEVRGAGARASRTRVVGGKAALSVDGGAWERQNAEKARDILESLAPPEVIPLVLALEAAPGRREWKELEAAGTGKVDGVPTRALRFAGDGTAGPLEVQIGAEDHLIRRVTIEQDALVHTFSDYREAADGRLVPHLVVTTREGKEIDRIQLAHLSVGERLPAEWFVPVP